MKRIHALFAGFLVILSGCSSARIEDYAGKKPTLDIREFMNGNVEAHGVFIDRSNFADPSFSVKMKGTWDGDDGTLDEHFVYSDGRTQARLWHIHFLDDHRFTATAADVVGVAQGTQYGNAVNMRYVLAITTQSGSTHNVSMDDWLYRMSDDIAVNHVNMTKFGFQVGQLVLTFRKTPD